MGLLFEDTADLPLKIHGWYVSVFWLSCFETGFCLKNAFKNALVRALCICMVYQMICLLRISKVRPSTPFALHSEYFPTLSNPPPPSWPGSHGGRGGGLGNEKCTREFKVFSDFTFLSVECFRGNKMTLNEGKHRPLSITIRNIQRWHLCDNSTRFSTLSIYP
jgi:hypothetical protein